MSSEGPTGRTIYDLLYGIAVGRRGWKLGLLVLVVFSTGWFVSHNSAEPGTEVSVWGLFRYTKMTRNGTTPPPQAGKGTQVVRKQKALSFDVGVKVLAPWDDSGCLYPAIVLSAEDSQYTVHFVFDAERTLDRGMLQPLTEPSDSALLPGGSVFVLVDVARMQWAPAKVVDVLDDHISVSVDESVAQSCAIKTRYLNVSVDRLLPKQ